MTQGTFQSGLWKSELQRFQKCHVKRLIEYVRGGHVGGENNKNIFAWELNLFPKENSFIVLLLQHGRRAHTLLLTTRIQLGSKL